MSKKKQQHQHQLQLLLLKKQQQNSQATCNQQLAQIRNLIQKENRKTKSIKYLIDRKMYYV